MQLKTITATFFVLMVVLLAMTTGSTTTLAQTAQTATPTAKTSGTPRPATPSATQASTNRSEIAIYETTVKLRERLQKILGDQDEGGVEKAAYIGEVTRISDEAITLKTLVGSEIIPIETATILLKRTQRVPISEVTVGNWLIVIGAREKNRAIRPEVLLVQTTDLKPREHMVTIGVITGTSTSSITLIPRGKTEPLTFTITKNSKLIDATGEKITVKAIPKDVAVIVVGFANESGWELGTLKTTISMAEYKSAPTPTPKPTLAPRRATPKPSPSPSPKAAN